MSLKREHFPSREVNTALQGRWTYYGWLLEDEQINTENYMKYSNTLTLCGEHDKDQNKGKQTRKIQTVLQTLRFDTKPTEPLPQRCYGFTAQTPAQLTHKSSHLLCLKAN